MEVNEEDKSEDEEELEKLKDGMYDSFLLDRKAFKDIAHQTATAESEMPPVENPSNIRKNKKQIITIGSGGIKDEAATT